MEVPEGVPSVSTQCPGLLRVLEPSQWVLPQGCRLASLHSRKQLSSRLTVASAADSWLIDPRVGCNKAYITTLVCNRHLLIVDLPHDTRDAVQHYLEFHFTFVRVYYLTTVEGKEFLPRSSCVIWTSEAVSRLCLVEDRCIVSLLPQWYSYLAQFHLRGRG